MKTDELKQHILDQFQEPIEEVGAAVNWVVAEYKEFPEERYYFTEALKSLQTALATLKSKLPTVQEGTK